MKISKKQKNFLRYKIDTDDRWAERAIIAIFGNQMQDEQRIERSKYHNQIGFNSPDAKMLSGYAKRLIDGEHLFGYELHIARKKIKKYSTQLAIIANKNYAKKMKGENQ